MCYGCWQEALEDAGLTSVDPDVISPEIVAAAEAVRALYEFNCVGGPMHIVTDDWNLEDGNLASCAEQIKAEEHEPTRLAALDAYWALAPLTEFQRAVALAVWEGFLDEPVGEPA